MRTPEAPVDHGYHSTALAIWCVAALLPAALTSNPIYLLVTLACATWLYVRVASRSEDARAWAGFARFAVFFVVLSLGLNLLFGTGGETVLLELPSWQPDPDAPFRLGGSLTLEGLVLAATSAMALVTVVLVLGSFNVLVDHYLLLRSLPPFLHQAATVVSIGLSLLPQWVEAQREIRQAQALRGHEIRGFRDLLPLLWALLSEALERALALAESMESRGFGSADAPPRALRPLLLLALALVLGGWIAADLGLAAPLGPIVTVFGLLLLAVCLRLLSRRAHRTRHRRRRWTSRDRLLALGSATAAGLLVALRLIRPELFTYEIFPVLATPTFHPWPAALLLVVLAPALVPSLRSDAGDNPGPSETKAPAEGSTSRRSGVAGAPSTFPTLSGNPAASDPKAPVEDSTSDPRTPLEGSTSRRRGVAGAQSVPPTNRNRPPSPGEGVDVPASPAPHRPAAGRWSLSPGGPSPGGPIIRLRNLTYTYPGVDTPILEHLDLDIFPGELLLVVGPSGSGKSSLLRTLNGLVPHFHGGEQHGQVRVDGRDPVKLGPRGMSDRVGFVQQDPEAHFVASVVEDDMAFALENHGVPAAEMARRIDEVAGRLSMEPLLSRNVRTLSGGERQRAAVAGALTLRPRILVLDEPTSQLDPEAAQEVLDALVRLRRVGLTLVVSEHRVERLAPYADRVLRLEPGHPPRLGRPAVVMASDLSTAPPVLRLAVSLDWPNPPLTVREARDHPRLPGLLAALADRPPEPVGAAPEDDPAITIRGLEHAYGAGRKALDGLDLDVPRGRLVALMGRNGSGKSTLLKCCLGLLRPTAGEVQLRPDPDGPALDPFCTPTAELSRRIGFVPQDPSRLLFHDTVRGELQFGALDETASERYRSAFGLDGLDDRHPRDLSTGERQRLAVAVMMARGPRILLLDEPTRGLDARSKERFTDMLRSLVADGVTVLLATHDVEWVAASAARVIELSTGRVVFQGAPADLPSRLPDGQRSVFRPQLVRLTGDTRCLTVEGVLERLGEKSP